MFLEAPRAEMLKLMARSRVLVHPSRYESQGYVFLEALMQGMSVVSYPVSIASPSERWSVDGLRRHDHRRRSAPLQARSAERMDRLYDG